MADDGDDRDREDAGEPSEPLPAEPPPRPSQRPSQYPPQPSREPEPGRERKRLMERAVPELVKRLIERAVESGVEKLSELSEQPEHLKNLVGQLHLPKEVISDIYEQIDDTKNGLYRVVAKEIRDVLAHTQVADEIYKVLTKLSFEIKTEIRFVPNDRAVDGSEDESADGAKGSILKPKVTSEVTVKDRARDERRASKRREDS